ncbi:MAG TPA: periplasmic heavy metal sensor [Candidatus Obscuribacterales bacterium]
MRNIRILVSSLFAFAILAAPNMVLAQGHPGGGDDPMEIYRRSGVSQEQEVRIRQFAKEFEDAARVKEQTMVGLMKEMHNLSLQPDPDEKAVLSKQAEINQLNGEMSTERIKLLLKIRSILSKEQKEKLVSLMRERSAQQAGGQ